MDQSIAESVMRCMQSFQSLVSSDGDDEKRLKSQQLQDESDRFKVWSRNIGAHREGRSSLEYRLRDASNIRKKVLSLLEDLVECLNDATSIISGEKVPWDQESPSDDCLAGDVLASNSNEDEPGLATDNELSQICADITEIVGCLLRLSTSIKNPAPHDRFKLSAETDTSHFEVFDTQHVRIKFRTAPDDVVQRLGKGISHRRGYFKYRKSHHDILAKGLDPGTEEMASDGQSTVASSIPLRFKSKTSASALDVIDEDQMSDTGLSQTSYATSVSDSERIRVPLIPEDHAKGPFECPFCFMMISVTTNHAWKKHVFGDLRPYMCLGERCSLSNEFFSRRRKWVEHHLRCHWRLWTCPLGCLEVDLDSAEDMKAHLIQSHPHAARSNDINALIDMSERPKPLNASSQCPLCGEVLSSAKDYLKHVGRHQEDLALFALPKLADKHAQGQSSSSESGESDRSVTLSETRHMPAKILEADSPEYVVRALLELEARRGTATLKDTDDLVDWINLTFKGRPDIRQFLDNAPYRVLRDLLSDYRNNLPKLESSSRGGPSLPLATSGRPKGPFEDSRSGSPSPSPSSPRQAGMEFENTRVIDRAEFDDGSEEISDFDEIESDLDAAQSSQLKAKLEYLSPMLASALGDEVIESKAGEGTTFSPGGASRPWYLQPHASTNSTDVSMPQSVQPIQADDEIKPTATELAGFNDHVVPSGTPDKATWLPDAVLERPGRRVTGRNKIDSNEQTGISKNPDIIVNASSPQQYARMLPQQQQQQQSGSQQDRHNERLKQRFRRSPESSKPPSSSRSGYRSRWMRDSASSPSTERHKPPYIEPRAAISPISATSSRGPTFQRTKSTTSHGNESYADSDDLHILVRGAAMMTIGGESIYIKDGAEIRIPNTGGGGTSRGGGSNG